MMFRRKLRDEASSGLERYPAVAILGPRQIGKTTLALEVAESHPSLYLDLENPEDLQKLREPTQYLALHSDKLVVLDEVQRYPNLFMILRGIIDARRREGRGNGRFLLLGSASNELLKQSSESLAGRILYLELGGLMPSEVNALDADALQRLWLRGGFPDSYTASSDTDSADWRKNFIRTFLERDIPQLAPRIPAATIQRFWTMLAHCQGELLNASKIGAALAVSGPTVGRYLDLMTDLLLARRLEPWHGNLKKRLVKSPKTYIRDSGLLHSLLQIRDYEGLLTNPVYGRSWEGFVIENILASVESKASSFFYRTAAGAEIDLLLEFSSGALWAVEIKASRTPKLSKGFHVACADLEVEKKFVVYTGNETFPLGDDIMAISLPLFIEELQAFLDL